MSWHFSRALEEEFLLASSSDGEQSAPWKSIPIAPDDLCSDKMKGIFHRSPFGTMFAPSTDAHGVALLMWFLEASPAQTSVPPVKKSASVARHLGSGWKWQGSFAKFDLVTFSWRTRQHCFIEGSTVFSETWPRWGLMLRGECLDRTTSAPITSASGPGSWPTPCHGSSRWGGTFREVGGSKNKLRETPTGKLYVNPDFWESLMGWPIGWTGIAPLATDKIREWQQQHGGF